MLNLYHLKYFRDAASARSIVAAARANRVSHSAVSQAIRSLEAQLGYPLLHHAKRRFELSPRGSALMAWAEEILSSVESALSTGPTEGLRGPLSIGCSHSLGAELLARPLARFAASHPLVRPSVRIGNSAGLERLLDTREIELGFGLEDGSFARFERRKLKEGMFVLVAARRHLPSRYLVGDKGAEVAILREQVRGRGAQFFEVQSWQLIVELARQGMGIGLVPDFLLSRDARKALKTVRGRKLPRYEIHAYFRDEKRLSPAAQELLHCVI